MAKIHKFNWVNIGRQQKSQKIMKYFWQKYQAGRKMSGCIKTFLKKRRHVLKQKTYAF